MPRTRKYSLHKGTGQAYITLGGRRIYLGVHGSPESWQKYARLMAELHATPADEWGELGDPEPVALDLSVVELLAGYWDHATTYYTKGGKPTSELDSIRTAARTLKRLYGDRPAAELGPRDLKTIQAHLVAEGATRAGINRQVSRIKRMYRWATSEGLVPAHVYQALQSVPGLRQGKTAAPETEPVRPVDDETIERTLPHLPPVVADMVRLHRLTGMRPDELCSLRPADVDRGGDVWTYVPQAHKTEHHGRDRRIFLGPRAQQVLAPYLLRAADAYCFSPAESERKRKEERRSRRKSKVQPSQRDRSKRRPSRQPSLRYTTASYRRAVNRGCDAAFPPPAGLDDEQRKQWRTAHRWSPNRLRHTAASEVRRRFGLEASQVVLGHAHADVTQVYAERDLALGVKVAREVG